LTFSAKSTGRKEHRPGRLALSSGDLSEAGATSFMPYDGDNNPFVVVPVKVDCAGGGGFLQIGCLRSQFPSLSSPVRFWNELLSARAPERQCHFE
jgi:hypothetical protein